MMVISRKYLGSQSETLPRFLYETWPSMKGLAKG